MDLSRTADRNTRRTERYTIHPPADCMTDVAGRVRVLDISVGGARLEHLLPISLGSLVNLRVRLDPRSIPMTIIGRVVWTRMEVGGDDAIFISGVSFDGTTEALRPVLERLFNIHRLEFARTRYA